MFIKFFWLLNIKYIFPSFKMVDFPTKDLRKWFIFKTMRIFQHFVQKFEIICRKKGNSGILKVYIVVKGWCTMSQIVYYLLHFVTHALLFAACLFYDIHQGASQIIVYLTLTSRCIVNQWKYTWLTKQIIPLASLLWY